MKYILLRIKNKSYTTRRVLLPLMFDVEELKNYLYNFYSNYYSEAELDEDEIQNIVEKIILIGKSDEDFIKTLYKDFIIKAGIISVMETK